MYVVNYYGFEDAGCPAPAERRVRGTTLTLFPERRIPQ
jgi:hypothetical protein